MVTRPFILALLMIISFVSPPIFAEPVGQAFDNVQPQRGEIKESVKARLGQPLQIHAPVGDPPITRWVYKDFTVYFEGNYVIHSVVNNIKAPPRQP